MVSHPDHTALSDIRNSSAMILFNPLKNPLFTGFFHGMNFLIMSIYPTFTPQNQIAPPFDEI